MSEFANALSASSSALKAQAQRLRHVSENIANADTPGYRRKIISFDSMDTGFNDTGAVRAGRVQIDRTDLPRIYAQATHWRGRTATILGPM